MEKAFLRLLNRQATPLPGAQGLLQERAGRYSLAVAPSGLAFVQRPRIESLGIPFRTIVISEEVGAVKPDAAFFGALMERLGVAPAQCLFVGDSPTCDIAGAQSTGLDACCLCSHPSAHPCRSQYTIRRPLEL